jgi:hypothetical protein
MAAAVRPPVIQRLAENSHRVMHGSMRAADKSARVRIADIAAARAVFRIAAMS